MRLQVAHALVLDALYQVLDNKVFRVLAVVTGVLVIVPLLLAFREEEIVVLFGFERITYDSLFAGIGPMLGYPPNMVEALSEFELRELAIEAYQAMIVDGLVGVVGIFLCLAATTFFIPSMLEKGTADTVFSKPVSRLSLLLARYLTGILFVAILASCLVFGTHLTLILASGYSDSAFLWSVPALVYKFAIVYALTLLIAVLTRSAVTSLIVTILFVPLNGCVHSLWKLEQMQGEIRAEQMSEEEEQQLDEQVEKATQSGVGKVFDILFTAFRALHYTLPKTDDAMPIARKLRSSLRGEGSVYANDDLDFALLSLPEDFEVISAGGLAAVEDFTPTVEGDQLLFAAGLGGETSEAFLLLRGRTPLEIPLGQSGRTRTESSKRAADLFEDWVDDADDKEITSEDSGTLADGTPWKRFTRKLEWTWNRGESETPWVVRTLVLSESDQILTFQLQTRAGWIEEHDEVRRHFAGRDFKFGGKQVARNDPNEWYETKLDWDANWRFNVLFSIGSSLGFAAAMILLSWWRLSRMDF